MMRIINKRKYFLNDESGFSLIEMMLASFIASTVFASLYAVFAMSMKFNVESRYEIIAANLAQEGVEIIRNIRDENVMRGVAINDGLANGFVCTPNMNGDNPECTNGATSVFIVGNVYQNGGAGTATPFTRSCEISGNQNQFDAICTVQWDSFVNPDLSREVEVTGRLTDWLGN